MKFLVVLLLLISSQSSLQEQCTARSVRATEDWSDVQEVCHQAIQDQVQEELTASISYLIMSSHFSGDLNYRPGLANFFLTSANEERTHAKKLLEHLLMRGGKIDSSAIKNIIPTIKKYTTVKEALQTAMELEKKVTESIKKITAVCEGVQDDKHGVNDYVTVDYMTSEFLQEQYAGMRALAGHLTTVSRMHEQYGTLAEVMFDQTFFP